MTGERSEAYGRVMKTLNDLGPSKLHREEINEVKEIADTLFFAKSYEDPEAIAALTQAGIFVDALTGSGRWMSETADKLLDDLRGCGGWSPQVKIMT